MNIYKNYIKAMDKSEKIFISRKHDDYFICNGYIGLKVPEAVYIAFFTTEKPYYRQLENEQGISYFTKGERKEIPAVGNALDFDQMFNHISYGTADKLPIIIDESMQLFSIRTDNGREPMLINLDYIKAFDGIVEDWNSSGSFIRPLFTDTALVLPIRPDSDRLQRLQKIINIYTEE